MIPQANIIITHHCNLLCKHCYMNANNNKIESDEIVLKNAKKIIDKLAKLNVPRIMITGGECTMSKNLLPILKYIADKNIEISLFTNGFVHNNETLKYVNDYCLSVDGNETYHNNLRGNKNSYHNVIETIKTLIKNNKKVSVQMTITKNNITNLKENILYLYSLGVKKVNLSCLLHKGRANTNSIKSDIDFNKLKKTIYEIEEETGYNLYIHTNLFDQKDINNYLKPCGISFPLWIDLIDNSYYMVDDIFKKDLKDFNLLGLKNIEKMLKKDIIKLTTNDFIVLEDELIKLEGI